MHGQTKSIIEMNNKELGLFEMKCLFLLIKIISPSNVCQTLKKN
jgi:hypothetical protein